MTRVAIFTDNDFDKASGVTTVLKALLRYAPSRRSSELPERWRVSERRPALLYAGRLSREKGLALFQTLERLLSLHRVAHRLVFVGDGPMLPELRERLPDAVFTGTLAHDEVGVAMASADVFVLASETDTAGNLVLEAQASGLPVLVSTIGGPRENIRHGLTGYACRAGDPLDFCWRVTELVADSARRRQLSEAARRYACARSWHEALSHVYAAYVGAARVKAVSTSPLGRPPRPDLCKRLFERQRIALQHSRR